MYIYDISSLRVKQCISQPALRRYCQQCHCTEKLRYFAYNNEYKWGKQVKKIVLRWERERERVRTRL